MAEFTPNFNLIKPDDDDFYNVKDFNDNADIIDQALKAHDDALATKETPAGAQAKANIAEANAKAYTDAHEQKAAPHSGHETPAGAQAKVDAAEARAKAYTDQEVAEISQALDAHKASAAPHSGHETPAGAQAKADAAETNAKAYTDAHEQKAAPHSGHETLAGAQAKANAALNSAKQYTDQEVGEVANELTSHKNDDTRHISSNIPATAITFGGKFQIAYNSATDSLDITVVG